MRLCKANGQRLISMGLLGLLCLPFLPCLSAQADDGFGANWQPKPLVDNNAPVQSPAPVQAAKPVAQPQVQPDLEARLKPVEPFVKAVENRLTLTPKPGVTMVQRLNTLQTVLFGTQKYQDAGQLITKLAEIFPQEAQKAQAEMDRQAQVAMQNQANAIAAANAKAGKNAKSNAPANAMAQPYAANPYGQNIQNSQNQIASAAPVHSASKKQKRNSFWNTDDFDSDFENDPFFQDSSFQGRVKTNSVQQSATTQGFSSQTQQQAMNQMPYNGQAMTQQSTGPSRLAAVAQGLAGIALAVGGMAGAYYLNGKGGGMNYPYNAYGGAYGTPYGYSPYAGMPYGYAAAPYGYNTGYSVGPTTTYSTGLSPFGNGMTSMGSSITPFASSPMGSTYSSFGNGFGQMTPGFGVGTTPGLIPYRGF